MQVGGIGSTAVNLQPLDESLVQDLKSKGLTDEAISQLQLSLKDLGGPAGSSGPKPPPPGGAKVPGEQLVASMASAEKNMMGDIFAFMAIFQKIAQEQRNSARETREVQMHAQIGTMLEAAKNMETAATARFNAALVQGIVQIGSGCLSIAGGVASMKAGAKAETKSQDMIKSGRQHTVDTNMSPKEAKVHMQGVNAEANKISQAGANKAQSINIGTQGASSIAGGIGTIASAGFTLQADKLDAENKKLDAAGKLHESAKDKANEMMQAMQDIIRDIRDKLSAIEQSAIETNRGIARNI